MEPGKRFPRTVRLRRRGEFLHVQQTGRKAHAGHFLLLCVRTPGSPTRIGITVSKRVGDAVRRNRVKRLVRETFRLNPALFPVETQIVVIAKTGAPTLTLAAVRAGLRSGATAPLMAFALLIIGLYQRLLSPLLVALTGSGCRFAPSCSEYARGALTRHGLLRGLGLTLHRLGRCHPLCSGGVDPVPEETA